jgi:tRNA G18 (ribose-2'-O)-methylase SpoU
MTRGYFGIGVEGISKSYNLGAVLRTAHAFDASFAFSVGAHPRALDMRVTDTSRSHNHLPYYDWDKLDDMSLPKGCELIGIELTDDAVDLPSFRHGLNCAYILGPEKGALSPQAREMCSALVYIPTKFCLNVSLAAALTLYDRALCFGGYTGRPLASHRTPRQRRKKSFVDATDIAQRS